MEFNEKLNALFSITLTKSNMLASSINIDPSLISRLRTGARKIPRDTKFLRSICDFFSEQVNDDFMLFALFDLTKDKRLNAPCRTNEISDCIFNWFIKEDNDSYYQKLESLFQCVDQYSASPRKSNLKPEKDPPAQTGSDEIYESFYGNDGKRKAVLEFCRYALQIEKADLAKIFSDETDSWMQEVPGFQKEMREKILFFAQRGARIQRVLPPSRNMESSLRDVERWIPAYVSGSVRLYSYPWARDELHRHTFLVIPKKLVLHSMSLYGQREAYVTVITNDPVTVNAYDNYFDDILERCHHMANVLTLKDRRRILSKFRNMSQNPNNCLTKSNSLMATTLPPEVLTAIRRRATPFVQSFLDCCAQTAKANMEILRENTIVEMMTMPKLENVLNGTEPVPGTLWDNYALYYTPEEYRLHLENIIRYLKTYRNYQVILMEENDLPNVTIITRVQEKSYIIKKSSPFTLYEVSEPTITVAIISYLKNIVERKKCVQSREQVIGQLEKQIARLKEAGNRNT